MPLRLRIDTSADNVVVDVQDASTGQAGVVPASGVGATMLADGSVTTAKLADGSVIASKLGCVAASIVIAGADGAGSRSLSGAQVGARVLDVVVASGAGSISGSFESTITVAGAIQQTGGSFAGQNIVVYYAIAIAS